MPCTPALHPSRTPTRRSLLIPLVSVVGAAWFALWACAPMSTLPVPGSIGENTNEFALTGNGTLSTDRYDAYIIAPGYGVSGQLSYQHRFNNLHLGGAVFAGTSTFVGGGVFFGGLYPVGKANLGFQVAAGWMWAEVGMPVTLPLGDTVWLYTEPSIGYRTRFLRLPIGAGFRLGDHVTLAPEVAVEYLTPWGTTARPVGDLPLGLGVTGALSAGFGF